MRRRGEDGGGWSERRERVRQRRGRRGAEEARRRILQRVRTRRPERERRADAGWTVLVGTGLEAERRRDAAGDLPDLSAERARVVRPRDRSPGDSAEVVSRGERGDRYRVDRDRCDPFVARIPKEQRARWDADAAY